MAFVKGLTALIPRFIMLSLLVSAMIRGVVLRPATMAGTRFGGFAVMCKRRGIQMSYRGLANVLQLMSFCGDVMCRYGCTLASKLCQVVGHKSFQKVLMTGTRLVHWGPGAV